MKSTKLIVVAGILAMFSAGCNKTASKEGSAYKPVEVVEIGTGEVKPGEEGRYFPLAIGNQWIYDVDVTVRRDGKESKSAQELTFRCTNVTKIGEKTLATLEAVIDGKVNEQQQWSLDKKGLYQIAVGFPPKPFNPPQPAFRIPLKEDTTFVWEGTGFVPQGNVTNAKSKSVVLGYESADTEIGRFKSIAIQTTVSWKTGQSVSTTWWAPDYGIVRYRQEAAMIGPGSDGKPVRIQAVQVMRLKAKSFKNSTP